MRSSETALFKFIGGHLWSGEVTLRDERQELDDSEKTLGSSEG